MNHAVDGVWKGTLCERAIQSLRLSIHSIECFVQLTLQTWAEAPKLTYPSSNAEQYLLWASTVLTWAHTCGTEEQKQKLASCNVVQAAKYSGIAAEMWQVEDVRLISSLAAASALSPCVS
jgi:hypothetical protein